MRYDWLRREEENMCTISISNNMMELSSEFSTVCRYIINTPIDSNWYPSLNSFVVCAHVGESNSLHERDEHNVHEPSSNDL